MMARALFLYDFLLGKKGHLFPFLYLLLKGRISIGYVSD